MATFDELMAALRKADAAGDTEGAARIAQMASKLKGAQPAPSRGASAVPQDAPSPVLPQDPVTPGGFDQQIIGLMQPAGGPQVSAVSAPAPAPRVAPIMAGPIKATMTPRVAMPVEDPLLAALRGEDVQANGAPVTYGASRDANDQRPPSDPFEGEGFKPLAKRRGQQFVRGATEVVASVPESVAITGENLDRWQDKASDKLLPEADALEAEAASLEAEIAAIPADALGPEERAFALEQAKALRDRAAQRRLLAQTPTITAPTVPAQDRPVFAAGDQIRRAVTDAVGAPDPRDVGFWAQAAEGSGNMAGMIAASTAGGLVGGPAGSLAVGGMTGSTMNQSQVFKEALDAGADQETALQASKWAAVIGAGEIIPINRALKILPPRLRGELATGFMRKFVDLAQASGEEAAQEYLSQVANNIAAQKLYDPERGWTEGATDAALVGAVLGAGVGGIGLALQGKPAAQNVTAPPRREEPPADPLDQIAAAMQPPAPDQAPKAPAPERPAPQAAANQTQPQPSQGDAGRYEILDEIENGPDGQRVPTGRKVRYDRQTGTVEPISPDQTDAEVKPEAQPAAEMRKSADAEPAPEAQPSPTAGPAPQADVVQAAGGTVPPAPIPNQPRNFEFIDAAGVAKIGTEPGVMQYKAGGDAEGVTDRLKGVTEWRPERAGTSIIYEYADGRRVIADGHQRLGLAKRLAGQGKAIQMPAMILRQADGVTPEDARVTAALKNIAEGSGTALDAAKVLRGTDKTPDQLGLPPSSAIVRDAMGMRNLSDQAFGMVINGVSSERDGGIVGRAVTDKAAQANILALLARMQKERPITAFQAESVARQAAADTVVETQDSLFGPEDDTKNLYLERAKILEAASKMKREEQSAFRNVIANADRLAAAGNQLDAEGNQTRLDSAAAMRDYLGREANTKGAISEALTAAARALNGGATVAAATRQFLDAVERELGARGSERQGGDQRGQAAGSNRPEESGDQGLASAGQDEAAADGDMFAPAQTGKTPDQVRAEAEAAVRAQQAKLRKPGGNSGDAGPLFNPDQDLFDPSKAEQTDVNGDANLMGVSAALRAELKAAATEKAPLKNSADLTEEGPGVDLEKRLSSVDTAKDRYQIATEFVLERGLETGNEHLVFLGPDGALISLTEGDSKGVEFPDEAYQAVIAGKMSFSVHNHPGNRGPSSADIGNLFGGVDPMVIVGHNGARHEMRRAQAAKILKPADAIRTYRALEARLAQLWRRNHGGVSPDVLNQQFHNVIAITMERLGLIEYDGTAATDITANGIETYDLFPSLFSAVAPGLRRSGYSVPEIGDRGGNRQIGADAAKPGAESAPRNPSGIPEGGDGRGRAPDRGLIQMGPPPAKGPAKTGNDALDGALDDLFGDESDVSGTGNDLERSGRDGAAANGMGGADVSAAAGQSGRGAGGRRKAADSADGKPGAGGGIPDGGAPPVGTGSDPAADGSGGTDSQPAASGNGGGRDGGGRGRLPSDGAGKGNVAGNASGSAGSLSPAARLAAIRGIFKEDVLDFVVNPGFAEGSAEIDPRKAEALASIFVDALQDVDTAKATDRDLFRAVILPLRDAGMTRDEVAQLAPYLEAFLADLRAGRVVLAPEPEPRAIEPDDRAALQAKADRIKPVAADEANIRATLPLLLPEQQDDVLKVERRFAKPDGHGMMITNGTGTGKTFSGGGVIKRFVQMGKGNILIVAPSEAVIAGWTKALAALDVPVNQLRDTKDAGQAVTITTYANLRDNDALASRSFDLVVTDESQNLMSSKDGAVTGALQNLRAITHRPADLWRKSRMRHAKEWEAYKAMRDSEAKTAVYRRLKSREEAEVARWAQEPRSKVLFLSATPFAYDKAVDYAEGYLFDYPKDGHVGRSRQSGQNLFMVQNFGYRIRYHKLTKPEAAVDSAVFEREFHEKLKREGVLTGRSLQIDVDYDRKFVLAADGLGTQIDAVLKHVFEGSRNPDKAIADGYRTLDKAIREKFDYLKRMQLLEAIKAKAAIPDIEKHLAMGRKVVVFHDYNVGGGFNPFSNIAPADDSNAITAAADLLAAFPDLHRMKFASYAPPVDALSSALGARARVFNGTVPQKKRLKNLADFNTDASGADVLIVQSDAGGAGISMHDLTGTHQRVLINLGMPTKPTTTLQEEGRILRVGTKTNAPFRYYTIGTAWERTAFASRIAERSGTVENLALGNEARDLLTGFIEAYEEADAIEPGPTDGTGGKDRDRKANIATPYEKAKTHYFGRMKTTGRRDQRDGLDFYPTAEPLAFKMVEWAGIRPNERVLEPSAGDGAIARYVPDYADLTMVEPSSDLLSRAQLRATHGKAVGGTFESFHLVNKAHVIVMNPPFGSGGKTAMDHLAKAAKHLRPGGRIVALIPTGPSADKRFDAWWESDDAKGLSLSAEAALPAVAFERAGTAVMTRVVIIDKPAEGQSVAPDTQRLNFTGARSINEFFDRLEQYDVRRRPDPVQDAVADLEADGQDATAPMPQPVQGPALVAEKDAFKLAQVKHAKTGADLFVATIREKVEREEYSAILAVAKRHGGYYSSFRGNGAVPGFQFKSEADRQAFLDDMAKPTVGFAEDGNEPISGEEDTFAARIMQELAQVAPPQMVREAAATTDEITRLMPRLRAELDRLDLKRVRLIADADAKDWQGMFQVTGDGALEIVIGASMDPMATLHHEVIHALRTMNLFTPEEWRALELAAERGWLEKHDIAGRYPDLTRAEQVEEAIAEEFSEALAAKKSPKGSALVTAFNKIARLFRALRNVLNGAGYQTAEDIFGRILAGEISKRQAGNTGVRAAMAQLQEGADARFQRPQAVRPLSAQGRAHRNTGMGGALFLPDRRVWEELTRASAPIWSRLRGGAGGLSDGIDRARIYIQDRFLPILRAQEAIERATGKRLPPEQRAYTAETTFSGKVGRHLFEVDEDFTKPIIRLIAASKGRLTAEAVGEWLYARHAIERNAKIASINPAMPDGGSGMTNAEAQQILADAAAGPDAARLVEIGNLIDKLRERTLSLREDAGLITHDEASDWRKMYRHYVPLKGFAETDHAEAVLDITGIGKRFNVRGGESRRALGRKSEAFNPLQAAFTQAQEVAIRAEKNRVGQSLHELAKDYPSKALWEVKKPAQKRYFNRSTGLVETRVEDPVSMILAPNEMAVKISGEEHRIIFHDERLARAAGTVGADQMGQITRLLSMFSRFWSMTRTMLNPEFAVANAFRDFQTAQFNIQAFGEGDKGAIAKAMLRDWRKALAGSWRAQGNRYDSVWAKHYREFQKAGAQVSFWTIEQPETAKEDLDRRVRLASGTMAARALKRLTSPRAILSMRDNPALAMIERANIAVDNAIRLAAFVEARKRGWSVEDAAFLAKELTVNFNRRGEVGANMNALYPFFNAAVQGSVRTVKALTSRRVALMALTSIAAGMLNDLLNAWLSDEDDDGQLFYDKVPEYRNERNFHIVGWGTRQNPAAVPMPYGYNIFPYAGQNLGKVVRGVKSPSEAMGDVAAALFNAFSPVNGGSETTLVSPFFTDPLIEMGENADWTGTPIYPRYPAVGAPDSEVYFSGASEASKSIASFLNSATGGDFREAGWISVSPETIDHLSAFVTGSAGAFAGRTSDVLAKALKGDVADIGMRDIPFLRTLTSPVGPWIDRDQFYSAKAAVQDANADVKAYAGAGQVIPPDRQALADLYDDMLTAEREMNGKGDWNQGKPGAVAPRADDVVMKEFNRKYLVAIGKVKP